jgi:hypothetical protein
LIKIKNMDKKKIILSNITWGILLWLFGYILGIVFYAFVPKDLLGWYIMPFGIAATLWVLFKNIQREFFGCYIGVGLFWTFIAVVLDYIFLVRLLNATGYYKLDVYIYYFLTFALPVAVGWYKMKILKETSPKNQELK